MEQTEAKTARTQPLELGEERELVRRRKAGDTQAFDQLVTSLQDPLFGLAFRLMGNYDDANDLAQEVFVLFFRKIEMFRGDCRLKTWLYRIMVNTAKNIWKKRQRRGESKTVSLSETGSGDDDLPDREFASTAPGPRQEAEGRESADALQAALAQLSPEHREAIVLRCIEDMSYEEIAEATESNLGTVKSRINRARLELRKIMKDWV